MNRVVYFSARCRPDIDLPEAGIGLQPMSFTPLRNTVACVSRSPLWAVHPHGLDGLSQYLCIPNLTLTFVEQLAMAVHQASKCVLSMATFVPPCPWFVCLGTKQVDPSWTELDSVFQFPRDFRGTRAASIADTLLCVGLRSRS